MGGDGIIDVTPFIQTVPGQFYINIIIARVISNHLVIRWWEGGGDGVIDVTLFIQAVPGLSLDCPISKLSITTIAQVTSNHLIISWWGG